jgi:hypothetical protein
MSEFVNKLKLDNDSPLSTEGEETTQALPVVPESELEKEVDNDGPFILYNKGIKKDENASANDLFTEIQTLQKSKGDMFLFGKITPAIFDIILKIYHENIVRIYGRTTNIGKYLSCDGNHSNFMLGIMELNDGKVYITISEEPTEDRCFNSKLNTLKTMLLNANITVESSGETTIGNTESFPTNERLGRTTPDVKDFKPFSVSALGNNADLLNNMFIDIVGLAANATVDYAEEIRNQAQTVTLINSDDYLENRRNGEAFLPFKKVADVSKRQKGMYFECNNGSTCAEAKLFSYLFDKLGKKFEDIKGFAAYWVAKDLPPDSHYLKKYSYCRSGVANGCLGTDADRLRELSENVLKDEEIKTRLQELAERYGKNEGESKEVMETILQPLAQACPGCLLNWHSYTHNIRKPFYYKNCITTDSYRKAGTTYEGGRKKKTKRRKNTTKRNKRKSKKRYI